MPAEAARCETGKYPCIAVIMQDAHAPTARRITIIGAFFPRHHTQSLPAMPFLRPKPLPACVVHPKCESSHSCQWPCPSPATAPPITRAHNKQGLQIQYHGRLCAIIPSHPTNLRIYPHFVQFLIEAVDDAFMFLQCHQPHFAYASHMPPAKGSKRYTHACMKAHASQAPLPRSELPS